MRVWSKVICEGMEEDNWRYEVVADSMNANCWGRGLWRRDMRYIINRNTLDHDTVEPLYKGYSCGDATVPTTDG